MLDFGKFGKFEILNPSENQNLRSLTLTPNLDFEKNFVIFIIKMLKFEERFREIVKIYYTILKFEILNPKISNLRSLTLNPKITKLSKLDQKSSKIKISHGRIS